MHRIDTSTAQVDKFGTGKNGWTSGNSKTGALATKFDADFCDTMQEEIATVVEAAGLTLDKADNSQLLEALQKLFIALTDKDSFVKKSGDTMTGALAVNADAAAINIQPVTDGMASYIMGLDSAGENQWFVGNGASGSENLNLNNYKSGASITLLDTGGIVLAPPSGQWIQLNGNVSCLGSLTANGGIYDEGGERVYSPNNCPFPVGYIMLMWNGNNPSMFFPGTAWTDLDVAGYGSRVLQIAANPQVTGGANAVTITPDNLPQHGHQAGVGGTGGNYAPFNVGTDNQGNYGANFTGGTYTDSVSGVSVQNSALNVQNAFLTVKAWVRAS